MKVKMTTFYSANSNLWTLFIETEEGHIGLRFNSEMTANHAAVGIASAWTADGHEVDYKSPEVFKATGPIPDWVKEDI